MRGDAFRNLVAGAGAGGLVAGPGGGDVVVWPVGRDGRDGGVDGGPGFEVCGVRRGGVRGRGEGGEGFAWAVIFQVVSEICLWDSADFGKGEKNTHHDAIMKIRIRRCGTP